MPKLWAHQLKAFFQCRVGAIADAQDTKCVDAIVMVTTRRKHRAAHRHGLVGKLLRDPRKASRFIRSMRVGMVRAGLRRWIRLASQRILSRLFISILKPCLH